MPLKAKTATYPAPKRGWISNESLIGAMPDGAEVLDNIFPTAQGARLRKGRTKHATIAAACKMLLNYKSGSAEKMFAASESAIYDITTPADPDVSPTAAVSSLSSGDWSSVQFATSAGEYLVLANGADTVRNYNGSAWSVPSITGVTSSLLSQVWAFKHKLWFVEAGTQSAWYLPTDSISGAATEFPLAGVFTMGGSVLFGATWSLDSGNGLDDVIIFVTTEGEIAVYNGTDPSTDFLLQGVYRISKPLNKNCTFKAGGDLAIMTEDGIVPVSEALRKDRGALQAVAITYPIETAWKSVIANRSASFPFSVTLWTSQTLLLIGLPNTSAGGDIAFVANARTGAWCRYTGWDVQTSVVHVDDLYFGDADAIIWQAEDGGTDTTSAYAGLWVPKFAEQNIAQKFAVHARFRGLAGTEQAIGLACFGDYQVGAFVQAAAAAVTSGDAWGTGVWGTFIWGSASDQTSKTDWQTVTGSGTSLSPAVYLPSNTNVSPSLDIIGVDLVYHEGGVI